MKVSYSFPTTLDCGAMGVRAVEVDYSYDKAIHSTDLMTVYLIENGHIGAEITDYLTDSAEDDIYRAIEIDLQGQLNDEAEYAAECERDRVAYAQEKYQEAIWEIEP